MIVSSCMNKKKVVVIININLINQLKVVVLFLMLVGSMDCTDQKDHCMESVQREGGFYSGSASSVCLGYLANQNYANVAEANGQSSRFNQWLADQSLTNCLYKTMEERKCDKKSEYIPHFGY